MSTLTLVTGGAKCGKSAYALTLATQYERRSFIATGQAFDDEMQERISLHKEERGSAFTTVEAPYDVAQAIHKAACTSDVILLDCLTVWTGNLMFRHGSSCSLHPDEVPEMKALLRLLAAPPCDIVIVTNEVGMGIVPENKLARQFRDLAGRLNQQIATLADSVTLVVSGIPVSIK